MIPSPEYVRHALDTRLLVFTDLDGTLLDDRYRWEEAKPALDALDTLGFPLILSSSKTLEEMKELAEVLSPEAPLVAENGAIVAFPRVGSDSDGTNSYEVECSGLGRSHILAIAHQLRQDHGYRFEGFGDWGVAQVVAHTGLLEEDAQRAMNRQATEPILWRDSDTRWESFERSLGERGVRTIKGGRFIHLMGDIDKAMGLKRVVEFFRGQDSESNLTIVALGDSPNDLEMLSAADIAVVIPSVRHPAGLKPLSARVIHAPHAGPSGWNSALHEILKPYAKLA